MKPKTKLQHEVLELHKQLQEPRQHEEFIVSKHEFYFTNHYKNIICLECNHSWRPRVMWHEEVAGVECPNCKKQLKKVDTENGGKALKIITYCTAEVVGRFQVFRYLACWKNMSKKNKPVYYFRSLFEEWTDWKKNKSVIVGRTQSWGGDGFSSSEYEIRPNTTYAWRQNPYTDFVADFNCPEPKFISLFEKYGIDKFENDCEYRRLIKKLEKFSQVETILKSGQKEILFHAVHNDNNFIRFWPQVKIAIRNSYYVQDPGIWYDYLSMLQIFRIDIYNPKFILPENIKEAHNFYMNKLNIRKAKEEARRIREREIQERLKAEAEESLQGIKKELFKDLIFEKGNLKIVCLLTEEDVKTEGEILEHCVYTKDYHKKAGILLMSARIGKERIETIEISLATYKIIQARGWDNEPSIYHNQIIDIVNSNMKKISRIVEKQKQFKELNTNLSKLQDVA
jgi:ssDNA-binding Zn-finger/Zn-ribbon topoisomerase 1